MIFLVPTPVRPSEIWFSIGSSDRDTTVVRLPIIRSCKYRSWLPIFSMSESHTSILRPCSLYLTYLGPLRMHQTKPMGQFLLPVATEELEWVKKSQYIFEYFDGFGKISARSPTMARVILSNITSQSATKIVRRKIIVLQLVDLVGRCRGIRNPRKFGSMLVDKITRPRNASTQMWESS